MVDYMSNRIIRFGKYAYGTTLLITLPVARMSLRLVFRHVRRIAKSFVMSFRLSTWNGSAPTGQILIKFCSLTFSDSV
jgi:hypothetical protein